MNQIPQLRRELVKAAARTYRPPVRARRRPSGVWAVLTGVAVAAVVAAVVVVVVALAGRHTPQQAIQNAEAGPSRAPAPAVGVSRTALISELAPLRRAQTKRDLDPSLLVDYVGPRGAFETKREIPYEPATHTLAALQRNLARVVAVPALKGRLLIAPSTFAPHGVAHGRVQGLNILLDAAGSDFAGTGPVPTSVSAFDRSGLAVSSVSRVHAITYAHVAELLPDGVKTLRLTDFKAASPQTAPAGTYRASKPPAGTDRGLKGLRAQATVHNNVAAFRLAVPTVQAGPRKRAKFPYETRLPVDAAADATWLGVDGQILRQTTTTIQIVVKLHYQTR